MSTPSKKGVGDIKGSILNPSLTSYFDVYILPNKKFIDYLNKNYQIDYAASFQNYIQLSCSETSLPGSSLNTIELNNDLTGVTERHAYRRVYDDRIDLTFYVDGDQYKTLRLFEIWLKYISKIGRAHV